MARPERCRKISSPPIMKGYKPFGLPVCELEFISLQFEEYESIRLVSYEMMSQEDAAKRMKISRPTLTRIYNKAIKKISQAFVEGKAIAFEGGNCEFDSNWFRCKKCHRLIEGLENHIKCSNCDEYSLDELIRLNK
jgi:predicted DNA-binding protein (UPF0251 family)